MAEETKTDTGEDIPQYPQPQTREPFVVPDGATGEPTPATEPQQPTGQPPSEE